MFLDPPSVDLKHFARLDELARLGEPKDKTPYECLVKLVQHSS